MGEETASQGRQRGMTRTVVQTTRYSVSGWLARRERTQSEAGWQYDPQTTLQACGARLQDETDVNQLTDDMLKVVQEHCNRRT
jgi:hypothetical protein